MNGLLNLPKIHRVSTGSTQGTTEGRNATYVVALSTLKGTVRRQEVPNEERKREAVQGTIEELRILASFLPVRTILVALK